MSMMWSAMFPCSSQWPDEGMKKIVDIGRVKRKGVLGNEGTDESDVEMIEECGKERE